MNIYLQHPVHGTKVATMEAEAKHDEKNGWKRYNPDAPLQETEEEAVNTLVVKRRRRVAEEV
jgi:hypothetical protein